MTQLSPLRATPPAECRHASAQEYGAFVRAYTTSNRYRTDLLQARKMFTRTYPDLRVWFTLPLVERVRGTVGNTSPALSSARVSHRRDYLVFLGLRGYAHFDWVWILAMPRLWLWPTMETLGLTGGVASLVEEAVTLGFKRSTALKSLRWAVSHLYLAGAISDTESIQESQLTEFAQAVRDFGTRDEVTLLFGSVEQYRRHARMQLSELRLLHAVLYHRGQISTEPPKREAVLTTSTGRPHMQAILDRYLARRRLTDAASTVAGFNADIRRLISWLESTYPAIDTFSQVTREHIVEFAQFLAESTSSVTGRPLSTGSRRKMLSSLSVFFQDVTFWQWADVPTHPLLKSRDLPKLPQRVPRYIPEHELEQLMPAIRALTCPYQRAALLTARWSGARREEIQRLSLDCLDSYPDGTARLRIPAGKTKRERMVPLNEEAVEAIWFLQKHSPVGRGLRDRQTGIVTRYLFMRRGKLLSLSYLFGLPLQAACLQAGLVGVTGKATVTAHRFRHTVGTQLARRGARLRTIQKILGHESAAMSMVYIGITDEDVRQDYEAVLGPGALIAGPGADLVRSGGLAQSEVDWLKSNFFKTELELGHCLRLPQEGPCECDLYLTCAKFVTSPDYAPRLRHRRKIEQGLIEDARAHGWQREVERHQHTVLRLEQLLTALGEPLEGPESADERTANRD